MNGTWFLIACNDGNQFSAILRALQILDCRDAVRVFGIDGVLEQLQRSIFDAFIVDLDFPGMPGLLKAIREDTNLRRIPTLVIAPEGRSADITLAMSNGASGFIVAPFVPEALARKVQEVCNGARAGSGASGW